MAMDEDFRRAALDYHRLPRPGKLTIEPTKRMATQRDLALAYSPGVAAACEEIRANPSTARDYTTRGNLVGVISNGTAVLGLGNIGALAGKPVMEGKAVLFKKFADVDVFDIEIDEQDPERFIEVVAALEPTFGAINLEDIKAPECFVIEQALRRRMRIPVFHDDQHGTAIVCAAAIRNGLLLQGKQLADIRLVTSGAGAAAIACVDLLVEMGLRVENVTLTDIKGVVHAGREDTMAPNMARYARHTDARALPDVLGGADIFLGLSAPGVLRPDWLPLLADRPLILALANPDPEINPDLVRQLRPDAIVATGRSDYANQVNNVLCFPFIFRGALDVGAREINEAMKLAAVEAIAELARIEASEVVAAAYGGAAPMFGPDYIIPKPFDPRLILVVAPAVARAAMESGVAERPIADFDAYRHDLDNVVFRSGQVMRPVFERARRARPRIVYSEGEDERTLRAIQSVIDEDHRPPRPHRPPLRHRNQMPRPRPSPAPRPRRRSPRPRPRRRHLRPPRRRLQPHGRAPRLSSRSRVARAPPPPDGRRRHAPPVGRGRRGAGRRPRLLVAPDAVHPAHHPPPAARRPRLRPLRPHPGQRRAVLLRHPPPPRPDGRADLRNDPDGRRRGPSLRHPAPRRPPLALLLRQ